MPRIALMYYFTMTKSSRRRDKPVRVFVEENGDYALVADLNLRTDAHGINLYINDSGQRPNAKNQLAFSRHATGQVNHKATRIDGTKWREAFPNTAVPTSDLAEPERVHSMSFSTLGLTWIPGPPPPVPEVVDLILERRKLPSDVLVITPYLVPPKRVASFGVNYRTSKRYEFAEVALVEVPYGTVTLFIAVAAPSPNLLYMLAKSVGAGESTPVPANAPCPCEGGLKFSVCHGLHSTGYVSRPVSALGETEDGDILFCIAGDSGNHVYIYRATDEAVMISETEYIG